MESINRLNDDILENVSGGVGSVPDDPQANGRCPECGSLLMRNGNVYRCPDCGSTYTRDQLTGAAASNISASSGRQPNISSSLFTRKKK